MGKFLEGLCDVIEVANKALAESAKKKKQLMHDTAELFLRLIENVFDEKLIEQKLRSQLEAVAAGPLRTDTDAISSGLISPTPLP